MTLNRYLTLVQKFSLSFSSAGIFAEFFGNLWPVTRNRGSVFRRRVSNLAENSAWYVILILAATPIRHKYPRAFAS